MIGADTSLLIDFFKGEEEAVNWMEQNKESLHLSENVVYEFLSGNLTDEEKQKFLGFVSQFPVHDFDRESALEASRIFRSGKRKGETVPHPDAMIAGSYSSKNVRKLATRNVEDFSGIEAIETVNYRQKGDIERAKEAISKSGIVIFPTETAYGIAADALDEEAIEKVYETKDRPRSKGLTVIVDSLETAEKYAKLSEKERKIVEEFMPGPLTLVAEKKDEVPDNLNEKFVFRVSSGEIASELAEFGPITATSANISGNETSYSVKGISEELLEKVDYVIDRGELDESPTSTIAEVVNGELKIHREGPIKKQEIEKLF